MPAGKHSRQRGRLVRTMGTRPAYDRILIVCEGKKTEPLYLDDIRKTFRIPSAHLRVLHSDLGTEPRQVVDFAERKFLETRKFEWVYAVFDRDSHRTYHEALARNGRIGQQVEKHGKEACPLRCSPFRFLLRTLAPATLCEPASLL